MELTNRSRAMLFLYFDTSDISKFADLKDETTSKIYADLISKVEADQIRAPISAFHVSECSHLDPKYRDAGLRRAKVLKKLSCGLVYPYPAELWVAEWTTLLKKGRVATRDDIISHRGQWFPSDVLKVGKMRTGIREQIKEKIRNHPINLAKRRAILKQTLKGDRIRPEIFEQYSESFANAFASWNEKVPFVGPLSDSNFIIRFLCGQIHERIIISNLEENLADTEVTIG
jgi:hypothetical protein